MRQFIEDVKAIGEVKIQEKTYIYINNIPFVPVKQEVLNAFRAKGEYRDYIKSIKNIIEREVEKVAFERKTSFNIEEICGSGEMVDNW